MKCHALTSAQRKAAVSVAQRVMEQQSHVVSRRSQYLWMAAMLNAGLSPKTINRVRKELPEVAKAYTSCGDDSDDVLVSELRRCGIDVESIE